MRTPAAPGKGKHMPRHTRQNQEQEEAIADAYRDSVSEDAWSALSRFNTYWSLRLDLRLVFFLSPAGHPACQFQSVKE